MAMLVPKDALVLGGPQPVVFVVDMAAPDAKQGKARPVPVQLGVAEGNMIQVTGGVQPGQMVVVQGNERLRPGQDVQIQRVLPPAEYPIFVVPPEHPVYRTMFQVQRLPQIPSIAHWRRTGGGTSERGEESAIPQMYAISDRHARIMVLMTHNTDIADSWEREGEDPRFFYQFSPDGYAVGLNVVLYAMTH
jgi:hypothetical protein